MYCNWVSRPLSRKLRLYFHFVPLSWLFMVQGRTHILRIHAKTLSVDRNIRYELLARLCPNSTGADLRSVCTEAGILAIRARKKASPYERNSKAVVTARHSLLMACF